MANLTITKDDFLKMNRKARREEQFEENIPYIKHAIHKSKKTYNRQKMKNVMIHNMD